MNSIKNSLQNIAGSKNVLSDETMLQQYSSDQSFVDPMVPEAVVFAETRESVQEMLGYANRARVPIVPYSSGKNLHGAAVPAHCGSVVLDMSRMNQIVQIDPDNWTAVIEPGVTYQQLQTKLLEKGFRVMIPFGAVPDRSVLTSYLERDPVLSAPCFETGNALIMDTEIILPTGELFRTGNWASGGLPGSPNGPVRNMIYRLWTGAQGTLGIMTKMVIQIEPVPEASRFFFIPFRDLNDSMDVLKIIQRREIGTECFILNNFNLSSMLSKDWKIPGDFPSEKHLDRGFRSLMSELPPWTMIICINGPERRTDEKITYETDALKQVLRDTGTRVSENIEQIDGIHDFLNAEMLRPWNILKKFNHRGSVHDITFKIPLKKTGEMEGIIRNTAEKYGYPLDDIGFFMLPLERARAIHVEIDLHCDHRNINERNRTLNLWLEASKLLLDSGAYFDRPYGAWAEMIYSRAPSYRNKLRELKKELDPNNILNPGKLCFN